MAAAGGPRDGWLFAAAPPEGEEWGGNTLFRFHDGDIPPLAGTDGLVAHIVGGFHPSSQWGSDTLPVTAIDREAHTVTTLGTLDTDAIDMKCLLLVGASTTRVEPSGAVWTPRWVD